jgi:hypothetical protein
VVVLVLILLVPAVLGALLFVMVSGLIGAPRPVHPPILLLGPPDLTDGNATIPIRPGTVPMDPGELRMCLSANHSMSAKVGLPPPDDFVSLTTKAYTFLVFWLDSSGDGLVGGTDAFRINRNQSPLPAATDFEFTLVFAGRGGETSVYWTTP